METLEKCREVDQTTVFTFTRNFSEKTISYSLKDGELTIGIEHLTIYRLTNGQVYYGTRRLINVHVNNKPFSPKDLLMGNMSIAESVTVTMVEEDGTFTKEDIPMCKGRYTK